MRYEFVKMQSIGNDFVVLDGVSNAITVTAEIVRRLADRHFGIGCDQVLLVQPGKVDVVDAVPQFVFKIFNQDGSEAEQCGNGARCLAKFLVDQSLTDRKTIQVHTRKQSMTLRLHTDESVTVEMGIPEFSPPKIPFVVEPPYPALPVYRDPQALPEVLTYLLDLFGKREEISVLAIGNPHAVLRVPDVEAALVDDIGKRFAKHPQFPAQVNVSFMQVAARDHIRLRVYERGVGETLGCGSGACAAVVSGMVWGMLDNSVRVTLPGGDAEVSWEALERPVFLTGSAHTVFHGSIEL